MKEQERFRLEEEIIDVISRLSEFNKFRQNAEIENSIKRLTEISAEITGVYYFGLIELAHNMAEGETVLQYSKGDNEHIHYALSVKKVDAGQAKGPFKNLKNFFKKIH